MRVFPVFGGCVSRFVFSVWLVAQPASGGQLGLLSIEGFPLAANQYVDGFEIQTWGVEILAVCQLPPAWRITAENHFTPEGGLRGQARIGTAYLGPTAMGYLKDVALVRVDEYQSEPKGALGNGEFEHPASFMGFVHIGTYGRDYARGVTLKAENFVRAPAARRPDPPKSAE